MKITTFLHKLVLVVLLSFSIPTHSQNLLVNGGFELGGAGVGFQTNYFLPATIGASFPRDYNIITNPNTMNTSVFSNAGDFPSGTGKMMVVDGSTSSSDKFWELLNGSSIGVVSGRTYEFTYYIRSISSTNTLSNSAIIDVNTNGTTTIPQLMSGPSICPLGNPSPWTKVVYRWTATTNNAQIWLTDSQTSVAGNDFAIDNLSLVDIASICQTPVVSVTQQPTCAVPTGTAVFTSPLNTAPIPIPTDLFISEVTDESSGALSYIEIYNGTGTTKNLTNYKIKIYNNGNPGPSLNCDIPLLGLLAHNDVYVISVGNLVNQGGVVPDMVVNLCPGFNTNDNVRLTTSADVLIDLWGRTDGIDFTPGGLDGYTYRRLATAPHPSTVWNPADWIALDPQDYTNIGIYQMTIYEYSLNSTTYQSSPTFTGLPPNTTYNNVTIRDVISGCVSVPVSITVNPVTTIAAPTVIPITYCQNAVAVPLTAIATTGATLNWYGTNATGGTASATAPIPVTTGAASTTPINYYVSQTILGCESPRALLPVYIGRSPLAGEAPFLFCDGVNTTATTVAFDFNNVQWQASPVLYQSSWSYIYTVNGGPPVSGTHTGASNFNVPVPSPGSEVTFTITWNGICGVPTLTRTCYADCLVTPVLAITNPAAVCAPNTVDITAAAVTAGSTGGGTLTYWTNLAATTPLANPNAVAVGGTYYIKSAVGNCSDIEAVTVSIGTTPSLTITNPAAVCAPSTVNLTLPAVTAGSTGGGTLTYWTNLAATTPLANPSAVAVGGTYYIKSTLGTCTDVEPVVVIINPTPSLTITNPAAVCAPNTVDITAAAVTAGSTGGGTLTYWTNLAATTPLANPNAVAVGGTYYIKSTLGTCIDVEAVTVTIGTTPSLTITNPAAVCAPNTVNLTLPAVTAGSIGGGTLTYWTNLAATTPLANPNAVAVGGTYYIKSTVGTCTDVEPVVVTINPTPSLTITNPATVCAPNTVDITAAAVTAGSTGGGTLTYWTNLAATTPLANPNAVAVGGTYYIKSTLGTCIDVEAVTVTIGTTPSLTITNPAAVCAPSTVNLTLPAVTAGSTGGGTLTYWTNLAATTPLANPNAVAVGGTYYIKSTIGTCTDVEPVVVTINPTPSLTITNPAAVCAPNTVDITAAAVTSGSTGGGTLTYWTNLAATTPLANPNAVAGGGTYYIKSTLGTCTDIEAVTVTIGTTPSLTITNPAAVCAPSAVNLTLPAVTAGSTGGGTLTYWTNLAATTPLANPSAVALGGTYYIKSTVGTCTDVEPVVVTINPTPSLTITNPAAVCAPNTVDIMAAAVTAGSTGGGTLTYWTNLAATTPLANPNTVAVGGTYYIKSTLGTCTDVEAVTVTISNLSLVITNPAPVCSPNTVNITLPAITAGSIGGGTLSYWADSTATTVLVNPTAIAVGGTYYIKSTVGSCTDIEPVAVSINANFSVSNPLPLQRCDPNNDGFETFDLTQTINSITGGNPTYTVSFHETQPDAFINGTAILNPSSYETIIPNLQTIYIRVSSSGSSCFQIVTLQLISNPTPEAVDPADYELCDDNQLTPADIGFENFNLTTRIPEILGGISPTTVNVTFYNNFSDAQLGTGNITNVTSYPNGTINSETIYVRIEFRATGCFDIVPLTLVVNPLPNSLQPNYPQYSVCDNDQSLIGYEVFDLNSRVNSILLGQPGMTVTFYESFPAAQNGTTVGQIFNLFYQNTVQYVQTLGVVITNQATGCRVVSSMDIRVEPLPTLVPPTTPYTICDQDQDGIATFNLNSLLPGLLGGVGTYIVTFHETQDDADNNGTSIPNPASYDNIVRYVQTIYVRAEDAITGCVSVIPLVLNVNPSPVAPVLLDDIVICDTDSNTQNASTIVDLTQRTADVLAQQPSSGSYTVTYYTNPTDAQIGAGREIIPATAHLGDDGDTIWVRVEDALTQCFNIGSFQLEINIPLLLTTPTPLSICDDDATPNNQFTAFDLTVKDAEISQNLNTSGYTVTYYSSYALAQAGGASDIPDFTNYTNAPSHPAVQTLGVVVTSPDGCTSVTSLDIRVLPIPTPRTNPPALTPQCDYNSPGDMLEVFDLTVNEAYIANGVTNLTFHYFPTRLDAENNTNEIIPATTALVGSNVFIRVENTQVDYLGNRCYVIVEQALTVNPLPTVIQPLNPYRACDDDADGITVFDLSNPLLAPQILGSATTGQLPADYTISYYLTAVGANPATNTGETPLPASYINTTSPTTQTIYIRVVNKATTCVNATGTLNLVVEDYAVANAVTPYDACDSDTPDPFDGVEVLNLETLWNAEVLGTQNPAIFLVSYYMVDPTLNPTAIPLSSAEAQAYQTDQDTDTIWIKVENSSNSITPFCSAVTQASIRVERKPNPQIQTANGITSICVDFTDDTVLRELTLNSGIANPADYTFEWFEVGDMTTVLGTGSSYTVNTALAGGGDRTYVVHVTNNYSNSLNCDYTSAPFVVRQSGPAVVPTGTTGFVVTNAFSDSQSIVVNIQGYSANYQYSLDDGPRQISNVFENVSFEPHIIHVWDMTDGVAYSCDELEIRFAQTIDYPHYFTPNGDGFNDTWFIRGLQDQPGATIYIFDRYGKLLKQISAAGIGWDGTYNGHLLPSDDYWFTVDYIEPGTSALRQFKAHFTLKR
ncbi:T9SS type B sorting domain-containing protein [Flavobacterium sp. 25HG05S-40]|uniref:T9SS type B sorting domain-containing protein n=1 Tax=Flavobacterium sp. 25HG05S-40 TaxID=3458682 RepID=UPI0040440999